jgi:glycosyltransferase involved in cell wall biosynthesis
VYEDLPVRRLSFDRTAVPDRQRWEYDNPWAGAQIQSLIAAAAPDIFHLVSGYLMTGRPLRVCQEAGIPTVVSLTDFWFLCPRIIMVQSNGSLSTPPLDPTRCARCLGEEQRRYRLPGRLAPRLMQAFWHLRRLPTQRMAARQRFLHDTLEQTDTLLCNSEFLRRTFIQAGISADRLLLCRQGVDFPTSPKAPTPWHAPLRVGYIGQIAEHKGVHLLVAAVRALTDAPISVRLYGDASIFPSYTERLRRLAAGDPRIVFAGTFNGAREREQILRDVDVVVVPSTWHENNPSAMSEALAHGVPVITADLGSMPEVIHHGRNGLLFTPSDATSLAQQMHRLIDEPSLLSELAARIQPPRTVRQEVDDIEAVYRRAASTPRPRAVGNR